MNFIYFIKFNDDLNVERRVLRFGLCFWLDESLFVTRKLNLKFGNLIQCLLTTLQTS